MRLINALIISLCLITSLFAQVKTDTLTYAHGDTSLKALLIYDRLLKSVRPGVIIFHENQGISDPMSKKAENLAEFGYVVLVADLFGKVGKGDTLAELKEGLTENMTYLRSRAMLAYNLLLDQKRVEPAKICLIGYSFGGMVALDLARSGLAIKGIVAFYPTVHEKNSDTVKNIRGSILLLYGSDDPLIPHEEIRATCEEMSTADLDWEMVVYGEAVHGFANPVYGFDTENGIAYNYNADLRSWDLVKLFLQEILR
jgi:dienelactone hydrolase